MGNRAMRRALERQKGKDNRTQAMKREIAAMVESQVEKKINDGKVAAMFLSFALALHNELGYGKKRLLQMLDAIDREMGPWIQGEEELEDMQERLEKKTGVRIKVD